MFLARFGNNVKDKLCPTLKFLLEKLICEFFGPFMKKETDFIKNSFENRYLVTYFYSLQIGNNSFKRCSKRSYSIRQIGRHSQSEN